MAKLKVWPKNLIKQDVSMPRKLNIYSLSLNTGTCSYNKWSLFLRHCTELTFTNLPFLLRTYTQSTDICDIHVTFEKSND